MVACIMIGVAAYGKYVAVIETVTVMSGLVVCGVLLLLVSIVGLISAIRHHQVLLFFVSLYGISVISRVVNLSHHFWLAVLGMHSLEL